MTQDEMILYVARLFLFVRETPVQNRGLRVEAIQHWSAGQFGDSWCCEFATMILDICFQGNAPIERQGGCEAVHQIGIKNGWMTTNPVPGDLFLRIHSDTKLAHHIGFVTSINDDGTIGTIAGNTSADGTSSNGDRVAEHPSPNDPATTVFIAYPRTQS